MDTDQYPKPTRNIVTLAFESPVKKDFLQVDDVFAPPDKPPVFVHGTVSGVNSAQDNIEFPWYWTRLWHPLINDNPFAIISVTPRGVIEIDEENASANLRHNPHPVGVLYRPITGRWYIYNLDLQAMEVGALFNVAILYPPA